MLPQEKPLINGKDTAAQLQQDLADLQQQVVEQGQQLRDGVADRNQLQASIPGISLRS